MFHNTMRTCVGHILDDACDVDSCLLPAVVIVAIGAGNTRGGRSIGQMLSGTVAGVVARADMTSKL